MLLTIDFDTYTETTLSRYSNDHTVFDDESVQYESDHTVFDDEH